MQNTINANNTNSTPIQTPPTNKVDEVLSKITAANIQVPKGSYDQFKSLTASNVTPLRNN